MEVSTYEQGNYKIFGIDHVNIGNYIILGVLLNFFKNTLLGPMDKKSLVYDSIQVKNAMRVGRFFFYFLQYKTFIFRFPAT